MTVNYFWSNLDNSMSVQNQMSRQTDWPIQLFSAQIAATVDSLFPDPLFTILHVHVWSRAIVSVCQFVSKICMNVAQVVKICCCQYIMTTNDCPPLHALKSSLTAIKSVHRLQLKVHHMIVSCLLCRTCILCGYHIWSDVVFAGEEI